MAGTTKKQTERSASPRSVPGCVVVTTAVGSRAVARRLAARLVREQWAACVQYFPITSTYRWKGEIETAAEFLLLVKTPARVSRRVVEFIRREHPYELPEITVTPIRGGLAGYLRWIDGETRS